MRRVLTGLLVAMFAFGFCISLTGCSGEDDAADTTESTDGGSE